MGTFYYLFNLSNMETFPIKTNINQISKHLLLQWKTLSSSIFLRPYSLCYMIGFIYFFPTVITGEYKPFGLFCLVMISGVIILFTSSLVLSFPLVLELLGYSVLCCILLGASVSWRRVKLLLKYVGSIPSTPSRQWQKQNIFLAV